MNMLIQPILAFAEGIALILSPCILPILPLILSSSLEGGKNRPFGIIVGFVLAFSMFALASRQLVSALGIDPAIIQMGSLILLAFFGLTLLSNRLSDKFQNLTAGIANIGGLQSKTGHKNGFFSGIIIGGLIGLIWTPCAGPILAAVLVQVILQESHFSSIFIVLSFAFGASLPMLIIALTGRKVLNKMTFLYTHAHLIRKIFGVIILISVGFLATNAYAKLSLFTQNDTTQETPASALKDGLDTPYPAPDLVGLQQWMNSNPLTLESLKGKVVLIDFWTYSCVNCVRTLPHITQWDEKYRDAGLVVIGIHAPEFDFEKNPNNVKVALTKHTIKYPVALDNDFQTWRNYNNRYWPAHYLINKDGQVVYTHFGEGHYDTTENNIRFLLGLDQSAKAEIPQEFSSNQTPETYLGYDRAERLDNQIIIQDVADKPSQYTFPVNLPNDHWGLSGQWIMSKDHITAQDAHASLRLNFTAKKVFLVLGSATEKPMTIHLKLNGKPLEKNQGTLIIKDHNLYELVDQGETKTSLLEITTDNKGLEAYAFTFGE
jgi:cytochrome c biogenesis protein CcdA/thiol-disulfide isomerase/thioredoxin